MKVQSGTYQALPVAEMRVASPTAESSSAPAEAASFSLPKEVQAVDKTQTENKFEHEGEGKEKEKPNPLPSRQLVEVQGNPAATAANAAKVQHELSPPSNPYPSVQELATVRRAQAMERAARAELQDADPEVVDRKV